MVDVPATTSHKPAFAGGEGLIPGMQQIEGDHTHRLMGGRRLFDAPRKLGYPVASGITGLNPDPHPYP